MKIQIVLSGIGGQGLISTGEIMGQAASIFEENMYATMTASYGSETRGLLPRPMSSSATSRSATPMWMCPMSFCAWRR